MTPLNTERKLCIFFVNGNEYMNIYIYVTSHLRSPRMHVAELISMK